MASIYTYDPTAPSDTPLPIDPDASPTFGDWGKQGLSALQSTGADINYALSLAGHYMGDEGMARMNAITGRQREETAQDTFKSMTPAGQGAAETWDHPMSALPMRIIGMIPPTLATVVPAALLGEIGGPAWLAAAGAGQGAGEFYKQLDKYSHTASDEQLLTAPVYKEYRDMGMSEDQARDAYGRHLATNSTGSLAAVAVANAAANILGGPGMIARGPLGNITKSVIGRTAEGAASAGVAGAVGTGVPAAILSNTLQEAGGPGVDVSAAMSEGAGLNMLLGAAGGAFHAHGSPIHYDKPDVVSKIEANDTPNSKGVTPISDGNAPDPAHVAAMDANNPPKPSPPGAGAKPLEPPAPPSGEAAAPPATPADGPPAPVVVPTAQDAAPAPTDTTAPVVQGAASGPDTAPIPTSFASMVESVKKLTDPDPNRRVAAVVFTPEEQAALEQAGQKLPPLPEGNFNQIKHKNGSIYYYDKDQISARKLTSAINKGQEGPLLGLTSTSKEEAVARSSQLGETPVGLVEEKPATATEGPIQVKAAAATDVTAPQGLAEMSETLTPGNVLKVETPQEVLAGREAPQAPAPPETPVPGAKGAAFKKKPIEAAAPAGPPRVLENITPAGKAARRATQKVEAKTIAENQKKAVDADATIAKAETPKQTGRKDFTPEMGDARKAINEAAKQITDAHPPGEGEAAAGSNTTEGKAARKLMRERAKRMLDAAREAKLELPDRLGTNKNPEHNYSEHVGLLLRARQIANGSAKIPDYGKFQTLEERARAGDREGMVELKKQDDATKYGGLGSKGLKGAEEGVKQEVTPGAEPEEEEFAPGQVAELGTAGQDPTQDSINDVHNEDVGSAHAVDRVASDQSAKDYVPDVARDIAPARPATKRGGVELSPADKAANEAYAKKLAERKREPKPEAKPEAAPVKAEAHDETTPESKPVAGGVTKPPIVERRGRGKGERPASKEGRLSIESDARQLDARIDAHFSMGISDKTREAIHEWYAKRDNDPNHDAETAVFSAIQDENPRGFSDPAAHEKARAFQQFQAEAKGLEDPYAHLRNPPDEPPETKPYREVLTHAHIDALKAPKPFTDVAHRLLDAIHRVIGDDPVTLRTDEQMRAVGSTANGFWDPRDERVTLRKGLSEHDTTVAALHEGVHALIQRALDANPRFAEAIHKLAAEFRKAAEAQNLETDTGYYTGYAHKDSHEFTAVGMTDYRVQNLMRLTKISKELAQELGLPTWRKASVWDTFKTLVGRVLGFRKADEFSVFDGILRVSEEASFARDQIGAIQFGANLGKLKQTVEPLWTKEGIETLGKSKYDLESLARQPLPFDPAPNIPRIPQDANPVNFIRRAPDTIERASETLSKVSEAIRKASAEPRSGASQLWHKHAPRFLTNDQLRQNIEHLFGKLAESNPVRRLVDSIEKANTYMKKLLRPAEELGNKLAKAKANHDPETWGKFVDLAHTASRFGVHPDVPLDDADNAHIALAKAHKGDEAKGNDDNWQARAIHPQLSRAYEALPDDLRALYKETRDFYTDDRNARVRQVVGSIIDSMPKEPTHDSKKAIADRVFAGTMTDKDEAYLNQFDTTDVEGNTKKSPFGTALKSTLDVQRMKGPYFPFKREGNYVVRGEHEIATPPGATREGNEFIFDTREQAHKFATRLAKERGMPAEAHPAYYDPLTGKRVKTKEDALSQQGSAQVKYAVKALVQHFETAKTEHEAEAIRQAMIDRGMKNVKHIDIKEKNLGVDNSLHSSQLNLLTRAIERNDHLGDEEKVRMVNALNQASLGLQRGNRMETHYMHRKGVSGESQDIINTLSDYAHASAAYRSRAAYKKDIDGALGEMRDHIKANDDENTVTRRRALQEYETRLHGFGSPEYMGKLAPFWQKFMTLSFIQRMMSTAHLALHLMHPIMTSMPVVAGRHGMVNTMREFKRAYRELGTLGALGEAGKGAVRVAKGGEATNFGTYFRKQLANAKDNKGLMAMFDELEARGDLHADSGFDVSRYKESQTKFDRGLRKVDESFRELTSGTESVNRYVTAVASYRLAKQRGMGDIEAIRYAKDTLANTQGLYSATNAAPIFRGKLKPMLQFKQYPQMVINLMGKLVHDAFRGETPEVRKAALQGFGMMMGTAGVLTGVTGLPNDVAKMLAIVGHSLGVTPSYEEMEDSLRQSIAGTVGPDLAKLIMTGVLSMGPMGVAASHRAGFANMLSFGEPKSDKTDDLKSWIMSTVLGAPGSALQDAWDAAKALRHGDIATAAQKGIPVKQLDDLIKAGKLLTVGKVDEKGRQWMKPTGLLTAATQAFGFIPSAVSDASMARHLAGGYAAQAREERANAGRAKAEAAGKTYGWKGERILGIARNRENRDMLDKIKGVYGEGG